MGCANSKLDSLPAVALCRDRCKFLEQSLFSGNALFNSHLAFSQSLNTLGFVLHRLFDQIEDSKSSLSDPEPGPEPDLELDHSSSSSNSDSEDEFGSSGNGNGNGNGNFMFSNYDQAREQSLPPPPTSSAWDFLNFFETYDRYEPVFPSNSDRDRGVVEKVAKKNKKDHSAKSELKNTGTKKSDQSEKKNDSNISDVMREIKASFEKASDSGNRISKLLSNGQRIGFYKDTKTSSRGLSSTLKKLSVWEQKLYLEVKAEERLRIILEKKCRQLKHLVEKKTDARKVDALRTLIGNLSIKLKVSIQVVDRISITISKLRDEEFLADITELIHGFLSMWKDMLDCHKHQSKVVTEAKCFDAAFFDRKLNDAHLETAMELKIELQNWRDSFSNLISTQKDCIKALNGWLLRCLLYEPEPEETPNNNIWMPSSPARIGAPPVFVLCNQWSETMDKFSDKQVSETINGLISLVDRLLEQHSMDLLRMTMTNKDMEKKIRSLEIGEQKMKTKKVNQAWEEKKTVAVTAEDLHKTSTMITGSDVQSGLKRIFSASVRFSDESIKAYEDLCGIMEDNSQMREKQTSP